jgi:hypothetical protein
MQPTNRPGRTGPRNVALHDAKPPARGFTIAAFLLALLGLALFPIAGIAAIVCGWIGFSRGDRPLGLAAMAAGVISFFASFVIAARVLG